jgi:hypothetical protein
VPKGCGGLLLADLPIGGSLAPNNFFQKLMLCFPKFAIWTLARTSYGSLALNTTNLPSGQVQLARSNDSKNQVLINAVHRPVECTRLARS